MLLLRGRQGPERGVLDEGLAFLEKPFTPEALAHTVRELLEASAARTDPGELRDERSRGDY